MHTTEKFDCLKIIFVQIFNNWGICQSVGHVPRMDEGGSAFKILTDKPIGKTLLRRPRHRWGDNIRMYLKGIGVN